MSATWHIVTCEYPPQIGGVSDHTAAVAAGLAAAGRHVHVWCPAGCNAPPANGDVRVHSELGGFGVAGLWRVGRCLNEFPPPRHVLVQWVPHGYGFRSLNVFFATWLAARALAGDRIALLVHEPYLAMSMRPVQCAASLVHRAMLITALASADRIWVSTPSWIRAVRPYALRRQPIEWLPIPAPLLPATNPIVAVEAQRQTSRHRSLIVGHFSSYSPLITDLLEPAMRQVVRDGDAHICLLGRGGDTFRDRLIDAEPAMADRISAPGALEAPELSRRILACHVMLQPYPDGISARRTTAIALLAHSRPVVTNTGRLTEPLWRENGAVDLAERPDSAALAARTIALLDDEPRRRRLEVQARDLHDRVFAVAPTIARLTEAESIGSPLTAHGRPLETGSR